MAEGTTGGPDIESVLRASHSGLTVAFVVDVRKSAAKQSLWRRYGSQNPRTLRKTARELAKIPKPLVNKAVRHRQAVIRAILVADRQRLFGVGSIVSGGLPGLGRR